MFFDFIHTSIQNPEKSKNGDFHSHFDLKEEQLLILTIADGVGSCVCDWKASQISCETFLQFFKSHLIQDIEDRLSQSLIDTDRSIKAEIGYCQGMKSTFAVTVWDYKNQILYYVNIGDSRIYIAKNDVIEQISTDETKAIIRRGMDGKPLIIGGVAVLGVGVTNVLGALETFKIHKIPAYDIQGVILATDGFYDCKSEFDTDIALLLANLDMNNALSKLATHYKNYQKDDMTILIARPKAGFSEKIIEDIYTYKPIHCSKYQIGESILTQLTHEIEAQSSEKCLILLKFCLGHNVRLGQENIQNLISLMIQKNFQDREVYGYLVRFLKI